MVLSHVDSWEYIESTMKKDFKNEKMIKREIWNIYEILKIFNYFLKNVLTSWFEELFFLLGSKLIYDTENYALIIYKIINLLLIAINTMMNIKY